MSAVGKFDQRLLRTDGSYQSSSFHD